LFFRYLAARLRHRDPAAARYLRQGLGIEERARKLRRFWASHLERTKAAQKRWIDESDGGIDLAVLGAGRLIDFANDALAPRFQRLLMIDADPSSASHWRGLGIEVEPRIGDLTGCSHRWQQELNRFHGGWPEHLEHVRQIVQPTDHAMSFSADAVLSLNVMSQLPIAWQDCVEDHLARRFGARHVRSREEEWLAAAEPGARWMVEQHVAALAASNAGSILLITDVEYTDYHDGGQRAEVSPALYGVDPATALPGYILRWQDSWQWDISPIGIESPACGTLHRVAAFALDRT